MQYNARALQPQDNIVHFFYFKEVYILFHGHVWYWATQRCLWYCVFWSQLNITIILKEEVIEGLWCSTFVTTFWLYTLTVPGAPWVFWRNPLPRSKQPTVWPLYCTGLPRCVCLTVWVLVTEIQNIKILLIWNSDSELKASKFFCPTSTFLKLKCFLISIMLFIRKV